MNKSLNIERTAIAVTAIMLVAALAMFSFQLLHNPMRTRQQQLQHQLKGIKPVEVVYEKPKWEFERWQQSLAAKPSLWKVLIEKPPPPPKPPEPAPNMAKLLANVSASRSQVGGKAKIIKKDDPRGTFMGVGEEIVCEGKKCTIKEITKTEVVFSLTHLGKEITYAVPRK